VSEQEIDPGWQAAIGPFPLSLIPFGWIAARKYRQRDGLSVLRYVYLLPARSLFLLLVALFFIEPWKGKDASPWVIPSLIVAAGASGIGILLLRRHRLAIDSPQRLSGDYRATVFIRVGLAEIPAFAGLIWTFVLGSVWPYALGLGFAFVDTALGAPGVGDLRRQQQEISARGSKLSLVAALKESGPGQRNPDAGTE
jgi:hypothetical protein